LHAVEPAPRPVVDERPQSHRPRGLTGELSQHDRPRAESPDRERNRRDALYGRAREVSGNLRPEPKVAPQQGVGYLADAVQEQRERQRAEDRGDVGTAEERGYRGGR
jgi:hypothetical protein